jgi:hypothetical protein
MNRIRNWGLALLMIFSIPAAAEEVILGLGYDRARDGHGFELHKAGDVWILYFYTFDRRGDPEWYLGTGNMAEGVLQGDFQRYRYDESGDPQAVADPAFDGAFSLDFRPGLEAPACNDGVNRDDARQVAEFAWRIGSDSGTWCTELLDFNPEPGTDPYYGGIWYGGLGNSGYGFTMAHMGESVTALVYYYDSEGQPRWALGSAPEDARNISLNHFLGYCRSCPVFPVEPTPAGNLSLDRDFTRQPDEGFDQAGLDLVYPESPFGNFRKNFTLYRLSDGEPTGETGSGTECDHRGAVIANLSQDEADKANPNVCTSGDSDAEIESCIAGQLRQDLPLNCQTRVDVFVPGTNAEYGAWRQFNHMFNRDNDRGHVSLQYEDAREADNALQDLDGAKYDQGVIDARQSLMHLLRGLRRNGATDIRVFGHSKGSHAAALVADESEFRDVDFYAFAQPGRTRVDIDSRSDIRAGRLGRLGYIEKLSSNLVGITFRNDEVSDYTGNGFNGIAIPERWEFPGWIREDRTTGGDPFESRIDHHNNYGGLYTDGLSGNRWRAGEGSRGDWYPYCATGDKIAWDSSECDKGNVTFQPWFWGSEHCQAEAFSMMESDSPGAAYYIGYSGPRAADSCRENNQRVTATVNMDYRYDVPDKDCTHRTRIAFFDLDGNYVSRFTVSGTQENDETWRTVSGTLTVPIHMTLRIETELLEQSGFGNCAGILESELWIRSLRLSFSRPGIGGNDTRTIIGFREGRGADLVAQDLDVFENTAWTQPDKRNEEFVMEYSSVYDSIKIEGEADAGHAGNFNKRVHLID